MENNIYIFKAASMTEKALVCIFVCIKMGFLVGK